MPLADAFVRSGKVRDLYRVGVDRLLLVASDRLSAFDVVLPTPIRDKGRVLTGLSRFWFAETADIVPNHLVSVDPTALPGAVTNDGDPDTIAGLRGRMMLGILGDVLPIECVARGYVSGIGLEGLPGDRCDLRHRPARWPARERPAAAADLHAGVQGTVGAAR